LGKKGRAKFEEKWVGLRVGKRGRVKGDSLRVGKRRRFKGGEKGELRVGENRGDLGWEKGEGLRVGEMG
jgi:hypothetical protein